ncbi:hypothetical protein [Oleiagrimonas sp. C23AA]|uniref:hypothetical protein n=1 Tax=Oleiagrimonas sp. C23AA TaxID=2719047 RepID=UPI00141F99D4|nr:hypothetical protein [Oleiagrimonas sp. C23AA]NII10888.1 hypothetical protein [Oleiagrimonas sp. C23AA]
MRRMFRPLTLTVALMLALPTMAAMASPQSDISKLNGGIDVSAHQQAGDLSSVNGSVNIGASAQAGQAHTVNGSITLEHDAHARGVKAVNGDITLERKAQVRDDVSTVNGSIDLAPQAEVAGHVSNVNGTIKLDHAHVGGGLETTAGDITVGAGSQVEGGILVNESHSGWFHSGHNDHTPRVVIGPDATVHGTLDFKRPVDLYVSNTAHVGTIVGAKAHTFDGARP